MKLWMWVRERTLSLESIGNQAAAQNKNVKWKPSSRTAVSSGIRTDPSVAGAHLYIMPAVFACQCRISWTAALSGTPDTNSTLSPHHQGGCSLLCRASGECNVLYASLHH